MSYFHLFVEGRSRLARDYSRTKDFKLIHRALDVKKVHVEVRLAELENTRLAARALKNELGDPDLENRIVIEKRQSHCRSCGLIQDLIDFRVLKTKVVR